MRLLGENGSRKFRIMRDNIIKNVSVLGENLQRGTPKKLMFSSPIFFSRSCLHSSRFVEVLDE